MKNGDIPQEGRPAALVVLAVDELDLPALVAHQQQPVGRGQQGRVQGLPLAPAGGQGHHPGHQAGQGQRRLTGVAASREIHPGRPGKGIVHRQVERRRIDGLDAQGPGLAGQAGRRLRRLLGPLISAQTRPPAPGLQTLVGIDPRPQVRLAKEALPACFWGLCDRAFRARSRRGRRGIRRRRRRITGRQQQRRRQQVPGQGQGRMDARLSSE